MEEKQQNLKLHNLNITHEFGSKNNENLKSPLLLQPCVEVTAE